MGVIYVFKKMRNAQRKFLLDEMQNQLIFLKSMIFI